MYVYIFKGSEEVADDSEYHKDDVGNYGSWGEEQWG